MSVSGINPGVRQTILCLVLLAMGGAGTETWAASNLVPSPVTLETVTSQTAAGISMNPVCSGDGTTVAFVSTADNLVEHDDNGSLSDVYVVDLASGTTRLVSVNAMGVAGNGPSRSPALSRDGQWVAFVSSASDLVPGDTNGVADVWVRHLTTGQTRCVSCTGEGGWGNGESDAPVISGDGRYVAFESRATNLHTNDVSVAWDVYVKDLVSGTVRRISAPSTHPVLRLRPSADAVGAVMSDDGETVVFSSPALNLAPGLVAGGRVTTNDLYFLRSPASTNRMVDLVAETTLTSTDRIASRQPSISAEGRYLAALRIGSNPVRVPSAYFRIDLDTGELVRVDDALGAQVPTDPTDLVGPLMSADGGTVIFETRMSASEVSTGVPQWPVVYAWDVQTKKATRVSSGGLRPPVSSDPIDFPWGQLLGASRDGEYIAFRGGNTHEPFGSPTNQIQIRKRSTGEIRRVSRRANGDPCESTSFPSVSFSDDGRRMAFQSEDSLIVAQDRNQALDVFLYDWESDALRLISKALPSKLSRTGLGRTTLGRQGQALSRDGRWLVFASSVEASMMIPDHNQASDVFVRDLVTGSNRLVSVNLDRTATANGASRDGAISADGRWVTFVSFASDLVAGDTNRQDDVFVHDLVLGTTELVSRRADGTPSVRASRAPVVASDGQWIAFESDDRLGTNDFTDATDVYLYDASNRSVRLVSETGTGTQTGVTGGSGLASQSPVLSPDGHWLVYQTRAHQLPPADSLVGTRVLARHLTTWEQERWVPLDSRPALANPLPGSSPIAVFSADGRYAALGGHAMRFVASGRVLLREMATGQAIEVATNAWLGSVSADGTRMVLQFRPSGNPDDPAQIGLWDRDREGLRTLSIDASGGFGNGDSRAPRLSSDGRFVVFASRASNLVDGDVNGLADVFIRDLAAGTTVRIGGGSLTVDPVLGADGRTVVFPSAVREWVVGDFNHDLDLFVVRLPGPESDFRVTEIRRTGTGFVALLWATRDRQTYGVEVTEDLGSPWRPLPIEVKVANGQATAEDTSSGLVTRRFYRIRETPTP